MRWDNKDILEKLKSNQSNQIKSKINNSRPFNAKGAQTEPNLRLTAGSWTGTGTGGGGSNRETVRGLDGPVQVREMDEP